MGDCVAVTGMWVGGCDGVEDVTVSADKVSLYSTSSSMLADSAELDVPLCLDAEVLERLFN